MNTHYHSKTSVKKWGGVESDYQPIHDWFDATKECFADARHRAIRHHSQGIFECEKIFGMSFVNSDGKTVYTRYIGEQHVKEDCNGYIPSAKEWVDNINTPTEWMIKTLKIED